MKAKIWHWAESVLTDDRHTVDMRHNQDMDANQMEVVNIYICHKYRAAMVQFRSMAGPLKFRKAFSMSMLSRIWNTTFNAVLGDLNSIDLVEFKYLNGNIWPDLIDAPNPS